MQADLHRAYLLIDVGVQHDVVARLGDGGLDVVKVGRVQSDATCDPGEHSRTSTTFSAVAARFNLTFAAGSAIGVGRPG